MVQGRRFGKTDRLFFGTETSLIARNSDLIPYLDDIFGLLEHAALLLSAPLTVIPETSGADTKFQGLWWGSGKGHQTKVIGDQEVLNAIVQLD